ncbi:MAG: hypothetical protein Kow0092_00710 [Deferrisomatales bacterium]
MPVIERFLGKAVRVPEDRRYDPRQGLWVRQEGKDLVFGWTEPAVALAGGIRQVEWLATEGDAVRAGEAIVFAITGKIVYLDAPVDGALSFNRALQGRPALAEEDPYGEAWLFRIRPAGDPEAAYRRFQDASAYVRSLEGTEGRKNPEGVKGRNTGMCKAVYRGIRDGLSGNCC